ncbi:MAG: cadherin-like beta sandwich domain-containing protein [Aphanocapsa feldmannii 277cV]|uniref:Cadherin-like beta sandwich domain-containing protein n=1 Tax=Aphanocapsa feldmannii 277cV TaxID=2507553 RepID=A0A524RQZ9_9CHRO|nr:MAG: cadherin-like beta sandwich domain-containing protein [Aphanocapsa feldmannii 277cV]
MRGHLKAMAGRAITWPPLIDTFLGCAVVLLGIPMSGHATGDVYVINTGQTSAATRITINPNDSAQQFTTGTDSDGYALDSVVLKLSDEKLKYAPPADQTGDNFTTFNFKVNDGTEDSASIYIMAIDPDLISGRRDVEYIENDTTAVEDYNITIPGSPTWTLSGDDSGKFDIDSSGTLTFKNPPDFESPADSDVDNDYKLTVEVNVGGTTGELDVTVTVKNEIPVFATQDWKNYTEIYYAENGTKEVGTYEASDSEKGSVSFALGGVDSNSFNIDSSSGTLTFVSSPDYANPSDIDADNVYNISIIANSAGSSAYLDVSVTIDRRPVWVGETRFFIPESNALALPGHTVVTVMLRDPDAKDNFDIVNPDIDGNRPVHVSLPSELNRFGTVYPDADKFRIVPYGKVQAWNYSDDNDRTISVDIRIDSNDLDYENPTDTDKNNSYDLMLQAWNTQVIDSYVSLPFVITVTNVGEPPIAGNDNGGDTEEDHPLTIDTDRLLENDDVVDADGGSLSVTGVGKPANCGEEEASELCGTVVLSDDKTTITYTPGKDFYGTDSFSYTISDSFEDADGNPAPNMATATVTVTVNPANDDPPMVMNDDFGTISNNSLALGTADKNDLDIDTNALLINDTDPDEGGPTLRVVAVGYARNGNIKTDSETDVNGDTSRITSITYTPDPGFTGQDRFRYTVSDGSDESENSIGTVNINVTAASDNADLNGLTVSTISNTSQVSTGTLAPTFDKNETGYTIYVASNIEKVRVMPTVDEANATVTVNGEAVTNGDTSNDIVLSSGKVTDISVTVTAEDKTIKTYTIDVFRRTSNDSEIYFREKIGNDFNLLNVVQKNDRYCRDLRGQTGDNECNPYDYLTLHTIDNIASNKIIINSTEMNAYYLIEKIDDNDMDNALETNRTTARVGATSGMNVDAGTSLLGQSDEIELDTSKDNNV